MFNERKIRIFLHVARTKSFTKSAQQMYLTQQAVSKSIAELESDVGKKLFKRGYRTLDLTPEGRECRQIFINFMRAYDNFANPLFSAPKRNIVIHVGYLKLCDYGAEYAQTFADIRRHNPIIRFVPESFTPEELLAKLDSSAVDIGFTRDVLLPPEHNYYVREIAQCRLYLATSSYAAEAGGDPADIFFRAPLIVNAIENEPMEESLARGHAEIQKLGLQTEQVIIAPDRESAMHYAELGLGVISVSENSVIMGSKALQFYPLSICDGTVCVWNDSEYTPLFESYCDALRKRFPTVPN